MKTFFIIGELLFIGLIAAGITLGGNMLNFYDIPSIIIMVGGSFSMALMSFSWSEIKTAHSHAFGGEGNREVLEKSAYFWECMIRNLFLLGILVSIIGIVQMLDSLENPDNIGACLAVALLTVFYGFLFSAILPIPAYFRLRKRLLENE